MSDKSILKVIFGCLVAALLGGVLHLTSMDTFPDRLMIHFGLGIASLCGLIVLLRHSTITKTVYWNYIRICLAVLFIGFIFKVQHYPFVSFIRILEAIAFGVIGVSYTLRYKGKSTKNTLDKLKLLWILVFCILSILTGQHILPREFIAVSIVLFWVTFGYFFFTEIKPKVKL